MLSALLSPGRCKRKREEENEDPEKKQRTEELKSAFEKVREDYDSSLTLSERFTLGELCSSPPLELRERKIVKAWRKVKESEKKVQDDLAFAKSQLREEKRNSDRERSKHEKERKELLMKLYSLEVKVQETEEETADLRDFSSKGMKTVKKVLRKLSIKFETETRINDPRVKRRRYDIRFSYTWEKWILEFDGTQHFDPGHKWHTSTSEVDDQTKTVVAIEHGFKVIRISYLEEKEIEHHILTALKQKRKLYLSNPGLYAKIGIFE